MKKRWAILRWACTVATVALAAFTALSYSHARSISYKESRLTVARGWLGVERDRTSYWRGVTVKTLTGQISALSRQLDYQIRSDPGLLQREIDAAVGPDWVVATNVAGAALPWRWDDASHFSASLPLPALLLASAAPTVLIWRTHRERRRIKDPCARCGYSLTGLAPGSPCPECGKRGRPAS